ncbi:hypothetical protein BT69DRAFT_1302737, partial [Atractiella rhizophila]
MSHSLEYFRPEVVYTTLLLFLPLSATPQVKASGWRTKGNTGLSSSAVQSRRAVLLAPVQRYKRMRVAHSVYPNSSVKVMKWVKVSADEEEEEDMALEEAAEEELKKAVEAAIPPQPGSETPRHEDDGGTPAVEDGMTPSGRHAISKEDTPAVSGVSTPLRSNPTSKGLT